MEGESGEYLGTIPAPPDTSYSMGVAVDSEDNIYLAQRGRSAHRDKEPAKKDADLKVSGGRLLPGWRLSPVVGIARDDAVVRLGLRGRSRLRCRLHQGHPQSHSSQLMRAIFPLPSFLFLP